MSERRVTGQEKTLLFLLWGGMFVLPIIYAASNWLDSCQLYTASLGGLAWRTVAALRRGAPRAAVELLVPDFGGSAEALRAVVDSAPDVLAHNVETVPSLYPGVRRGAEYGRSLEMIRRAAALAPSLPLKSGVMVVSGRGKRRSSRCSATCSRPAAGSSPSGSTCLPPGPTFPRRSTCPRSGRYAGGRGAIGFAKVLSGPLVRSSYKPG